ncbi:MAG: IclR family transcriptional regulator [Acetobacteraceae bacterium]|nr:IclR family transcriptional regulator [Acetobacteraceae bacterium]
MDQPVAQPGVPRATRAGGIAAVQSALAVLKALPADGTTIGVNELARRLGLHKSKVSRLLATMQPHDFVQRDAETGQVSLGLGLVLLASPLLGRLDIAKLARPSLNAIARETGETALLAQWCGREVVMVDQTIGTRAIVHYSWPGKSVLAHATAAGKVLLAFLSPDERERALAAPLVRRTRFTITDPRRLRSELARVARLGFAQNDEEHELESCGVAAPVRNFRGEVVAAVTLALPKTRFDPQAARVRGAVARAAEEVSRRLGWSPEPMPRRR